MFEYFDVWMTLLPELPVWKPDEFVQALHEQGLDVEVVERTEAPELPWGKVAFASDNATVECFLYSSCEPAASIFLEQLQETLPSSHSLPIAVSDSLSCVRYIAQTIKTGGDFETAAELEYGVNCCLAFQEERSKNQALWFMQNGPQMAFCDTAHSDPGEIVWKGDASAYRKAIVSRLD